MHVYWSRCSSDNGVINEDELILGQNKCKMQFKSLDAVGEQRENLVVCVKEFIWIVMDLANHLLTVAEAKIVFKFGFRFIVRRAMHKYYMCLRQARTSRGIDLYSLSYALTWMIMLHKGK